MNLNTKTTLLALFLTAYITAGNATEVCKILPGSTTCGAGTVNSLTGNGMVTINGTTITGSTSVNGLLSAKNASFTSLDVNGSTNLIQCKVKADAAIKGSLSAYSTKFQGKLEIHSNLTRFINSKISGDLHILHTQTKHHIVYLDKFSKVSGDVIFDDGDGEVIVRGNSQIEGKVIGGHQTIQPPFN